MGSVWPKVGLYYVLSNPETVFDIIAVSDEVIHNSDAVHRLYIVYSECMIFSLTKIHSVF
jgi:hypothetical protein